MTVNFYRSYTYICANTYVWVQVARGATFDDHTVDNWSIIQGPRPFNDGRNTLSNAVCLNTLAPHETARAFINNVLASYGDDD